MDFPFPKPNLLAETDDCSIADEKSVIFNKFDQAESIVGFYGAPSPEKNKDDEYYEGSELDQIDDYPEEEGEEEGLNLKDDDHVSAKISQIERLLNDQDILNSKYKPVEPREELSNIKITFDGVYMTITNMVPYNIYRNNIERIIVQHPEAKATFYDHKLNSEWEIMKMTRLKKKLAKAKQTRDEFLRIGDRKLRACFEKGRFKKVDGIQGNVYRDTYSPPETLEICGTHLGKDFHSSDENMELTLEGNVSHDNVMDSDLEIDMDDARGDDDSEPETLVEPADDDRVQRNLSDMDLTPKKTKEDDEESSASDLEFPVSDELKKLQKLHKIPNDVLRIICFKHVQNAMEKEVNEEEMEEEEDLGAEEDENETLEDESNEKEEETEEQDENELNNNNNNNNNNKKDTHHQEDASSTTGSVLSEIQNTVAVGTDQQPPPAPVVLQPTGQHQENKIIMGCVGISREQLPNVRIAWVPTREIINHYMQFDNQLYRMAHAPDGTRLMNNEQLLRALMDSTAV